MNSVGCSAARISVHGLQFDIGERQKWGKILVENRSQRDSIGSPTGRCSPVVVFFG